MKLIDTEKVENYINENLLSKSSFCRLCGIQLRTLDFVLRDEHEKLKIMQIYKIAHQML